MTSSDCSVARPMSMQNKNRDLLQKICYKKSASIDMTTFGFINDSKVSPVNMLMKPLREKLEDICGHLPSGPSNNPMIKSRNKSPIKKDSNKPVRTSNTDRVSVHKKKGICDPKKFQPIEPEESKKRVRYQDEMPIK